MIPVLMALILILNLTAPAEDAKPVRAEYAIWLFQPDTQIISVITDQPDAWLAHLGQTHPELLLESRDLSPLTAIRITGEAAWLDDPWPTTAHALVVMHDVPLNVWERALNRLRPIPEIERPRLDPNFALKVLASRLADSPKPDVQFEAQRKRLIEQIANAPQNTDRHLSLLERMAAENLPPDWSTQTVQRLQALTYDDLEPWLTP